MIPPRVVTALVVAIVGAAPQVLLPPGPAVAAYHVVVWSSLVVTAVVVRRRHLPVGWLLMVLGWLCWAIGDVIWDVVYLNGDYPFPSVADAFYLAGYPLLAAGLLQLVRARHPAGDRRAALDAGIVTIGALLLTWVYVLVPISSEKVPALVWVVSVAYPLGDLLCLGVAARLATGRLHQEGARVPVALVLLLVSIGIDLAADGWFTVVSVQSGDGSSLWLSGLYVIAFVLGAASAADPSAVEVVRPVPVSDPAVSPFRLSMLAALTMLGPLVLLVQWSRGDVSAVPAVVVCTAAMFVLVLARMADLVAALRRSQVRLHHEATHDQLTGLANRSLFTDALASAAGTSCAVLLIDLDDFKAVNDTLGHAAGDAALVTVARRLESAVRAGDVVARLSGDEFAVVLPDTTDGALDAVVDRVRQAVNADVELDGHPWRLSASVGAASAPGGPFRADDLVRRADAAMYDAKRGRRHAAA